MIRFIASKSIVTPAVFLIAVITPVSASAATWQDLDLATAGNWTASSSTGCTTTWSPDASAPCSLYFDSGVLKFTMWGDTYGADETRFVNVRLITLIYGPDVDGLRMRTRVSDTAPCASFSSVDTYYEGRVAIAGYAGNKGGANVSVSAARNFYSVLNGVGRLMISQENTVRYDYVTAPVSFGNFANQTTLTVGPREATEWKVHEITWKNPRDVVFKTSAANDVSQTMHFASTLAPVDTGILTALGETGSPGLSLNLSASNKDTAASHSIGDCTIEIEVVQVLSTPVPGP